MQPLVEIVAPDIELQGFAPDSYRLAPRRFVAELSGLSRLASSASIIYLPRILLDTEPFTIKWLSQVIFSLQNRGESLTLILGALTLPTGDRERVLRRRLSQWMDRNVLNLYITEQNITEQLSR